MSLLTRLELWPLRAAWVLLAMIAGGPMGEALADRSAPVSWVIVIAAWSAWVGALVALLVPRTLSLTVVRIVVPSAWAGALAVAVTTDAGVSSVAAAAVATGAAVLAFAPWVTDAFIDGSSYGPERRIALRVPATLVALAVAAWALLVAGLLAGPLLLASRQWMLGLVATVVGMGVAALCARSIHQLSRRWLVLVPTGLVLHDPITMPEPQLFLRQTMARLGPAAAEATGAEPADPLMEDLTAGASGLVMELALDQPVELLVRDGRRAAVNRSVTAVRFTPTLPGVLLAEAAQRRLPVG